VANQAKVVGGSALKEEPTHYSYSDLERDGTTVWNGVDNNLARMHLRDVKVGDRVLYYHSGTEKAVVGEMTVVEGPTADPNSDDPKAVVVTVRPVRRLRSPVSLARIKQEPSLAQWDLVRNSRLSVMPVSAQEWRRIEELSRES